MRGTIKAVRSDLHCLWIRCTEVDPWQEYFAHANDCNLDAFEYFTPGMQVTFEGYVLSHDPRPRATNITITQETR
jgi:hypothetical protein